MGNYSTIIKKHRSCSICGKPSGGWVKCLICRGKEYSKNSQERRAKKETNNPTDMELEKWYKFIHKKFNGICQETGRPLEYDKSQCCHLLPKSKYPFFKKDIRNGLLLSSDIHAIIDRGGINQRKGLKVWPLISKIRKELLEESGLEYNEDHWLKIAY